MAIIAMMNVLTALRSCYFIRRWRWALTVSALSLAILLVTAAPALITDLPFADSQTRPLTIRDLQQAAYYYNRYHQLAPNDPLGLKQLTEVCTALQEIGVEDENCLSAAERVVVGQVVPAIAVGTDEKAEEEGSDGGDLVRDLRETLAARTDDRRAVAELLNVPMEEVELGANLIGESGQNFWRLVRKVGGSHNDGLFVGGEDDLEYAPVLRMDALWIGDEEGLYWPRAGYRSPSLRMSDIPESIGVLSFLYQTKGETSAWVVVSEKDHSDKWDLARTDGQWRRGVVLIRTREGPATELWIEFRVAKVDSIAFQSIQFRELTLPGKSRE
jgi:hypothetical protein